MFNGETSQGNEDLTDSSGPGPEADAPPRYTPEALKRLADSVGGPVMGLSNDGRIPLRNGPTARLPDDFMRHLRPRG